MATIKSEPRDVGYEDDESISPASEAGDEDVYEDAGDLNMAAAETKVWLVRMPKFLRDSWLAAGTTANSGDLGTVRIRQDNSSDIRLILAESAATASLPREYKLAVTNQTVRNTYVFSERNLDRFEDGARARGKRPDRVRKQPQPRFVPYGRVNIPKKTALVGTVYHEASLTVSAADQNYSAFIARRQQQTEAAPRPQVTLLNEIPGVTTAMAGPSMKESLFMRSSHKRDRERLAIEGKASRMPRNELLDLLFKLFEEYDYWSLKSLRERTKQPEAFLKEVLESIAILNKKGPYALRYSLKPEYKGGRKDESD
ncbi:transcription initiation factor IIF, beta subunit [Dipodascopsis tothii]|uniref:transcription initiation factor IIF, beta subunit n=1 Tax=Dipodascopsis tothii TaxID=44089 RepID=UPI0034CEEF11